MPFLGTWTVGDTINDFAWLVKNLNTGALVDLTGCSGQLVKVRRQGERAVVTFTPTMGGAAGSIAFYPGGQASLDGGVGTSAKFEIWAEFDLGGRHYVIPPDGPDTIVMLHQP